MVGFDSIATFKKFVSCLKEKFITKDEFNNLEIGGVNYLQNSDFTFEDIYPFRSYNSTISVEVDDIYGQSLKVISSNASNFCGINTYADYFTTDSHYIVTGSKYSYSVYVKADENTSVYIGYQGGTTTYLKEFQVTTGWQRIKVEGEVATTDDYRLRIYTKSTIPFYITRAQFELGDKATDWSPAPNDIDYDSLLNQIQSISEMLD